jgi:hypothetical protein
MRVEFIGQFIDGMGQEVLFLLPSRSNDPLRWASMSCSTGGAGEAEITNPYIVGGSASSIASQIACACSSG